MPSDESKGSQLDAIGSLAQRQLDNTFGMGRFTPGSIESDGVLGSRLGFSSLGRWR